MILLVVLPWNETRPLLRIDVPRLKIF